MLTWNQVYALNRRSTERADDGFEARNLALSLLLNVDLEGSYANIAVPAALKKESLASRDKAFVTELVYGTLRQSIMYDAIIESASGRKKNKIDSIPLNILRMTAHQLLSLHTPPHAAVDNAVRLTVRNKSGSASGFVNAISRRISEKNREQWLEQITAKKEMVEKLALQYAHPRWIVESYVERLGEFDRVIEELSANNVNPDVTGVIYPGHHWSESTVSESSPCAWTEAAIYLRGNPELIPEIRSAIAGIQDQGSYLVTRALALAPSEMTNDSSTRGLWLDMCAGPGGKAALLSRWANQEGRSFLGIEVSEHRAELIRRVSPSIVVADATHPPVAQESVEKILLDAPCSGLGALRRRPDARLRKSKRDLEGLVNLQRELLRSAHGLLHSGGLLAYVTCSPTVEETVSNTQWFLKSFADMEFIDARSFFPTGMTLGERFDVQLWPGLHQTDAMYLAMFKKKSTNG